MAENEYTTTRILLKSSEGGVTRYFIPYVPDATADTSGLILPDGTSLQIVDGKLSVASEYITETELNAKGYITEVPAEYITETELNAKGYLTEIPTECITETELETVLETLTAQINAAT